MSNHTKTTERSIVLKDKISGYDKKLLIKTFRLPDGVLENFFINDDSDSVQVFAITSNNEVLLVKQYRPNVERPQIELPGGGVEEDETVLEEVAARELLEETGHEGDIEHLGSQHYSPYSTGMKHMFLAKDCQKISAKDLDDNEFLSVKRVSLDDFMILLENAEVRGIDTAFLALKHLGLLSIS